MRLTLSAFALVVIGLSFVPIVVLRAATPVQTKTNTRAAPPASEDITFDGAPTVGNTIVCGLTSNGTGGLASISGGSSSWTQRFIHTATNTKIWIYDGTANGSSTITFTTTNNSTTPSLICAELDGAYTFDSVATVATGTTSPVQTNAVTTTAVETFLLAVTAKSSGSTTGAPTDSFNAITLDVSNGRHAGAYRNATSAGSYTTSWTTNATAWATTIVAYAEPSGGGGGGGAVTKGLTLLGVGNE
jgi:hypothetical protein